jgi:SAM-dependent methyltransferase
LHKSALEAGRIFFEVYWQAGFQHILDVGSYDVNGTLRSVKPEGADYTGVDLEPGPAVDLVLKDPHHLPFDDERFDVVVSTSCMEHDTLFWLSFAEMLRVVKRGGLVYVNAPSNGNYHGYPFDSWRFYPDAGHALAHWSEHVGTPAELIESFIGKRCPHFADNVMVFARKPFDQTLPQQLICDRLPGASNIRRRGSDELERFYAEPEDVRDLKQAQAQIADLQAQLEQCETRVSAFKVEQAAMQRKAPAPLLSLATIRNTKRNTLARIKPTLRRLFGRKRLLRVARWFYYRPFIQYLLKADTPVSPTLRQAVMRRRGLSQQQFIELGFVERAVSELEQLTQSSQRGKTRLEAHWTLALYYLKRPGIENQKKALDSLEFLCENERASERLAQINALKSECLAALGRDQEAYEVALAASKAYQEPTLSLTLANRYLEHQDSGSSEQRDALRLSLINAVLADHGLEPLALADARQPLTIDNIVVPDCTPRSLDGPKVTVIVPSFNAQSSISTALSALIGQTWDNLEILVVDDASDDDTCSIVNDWTKQDSRIQLIQSPENTGPYVARNLGLAAASGEFVTVHDADDWSHPRKIERQAQHLVKKIGSVANLSQCSRVSTDLRFELKLRDGRFLYKNMSSFMFRRVPVLKEAGYWDSVRFSGDSEFIKRLIRIYGDGAVVNLTTGPLSFARFCSSSLTGNAHFGYPGFFMGARKAYLEAYTQWHGEEAAPFVEFPLKSRPFSVVAPMLPREMPSLATQVDHLDVIIATEFRLTGGTISSTLEEIHAQKTLGLQTGVIPLSRYDLNPKNPWNPKILKIIDGHSVHLLAYGQEVTCDLLIVRHPPVLQEHQCFLPKVNAKHVIVVVNQAPFRDYQIKGSQLYSADRCQQNLMRLFACEQVVWHPIGPAVRAALLDHLGGIEGIEVADDDWVNIIDVEKFRVPARERGSRPVIGRHSRDQYVKWPDNREELLKIYPDQEPFEVKVLGGAETPKQLLGELPENWTVYPFDSMPVTQFLAEIDVCVYFTHPGLIEAFGRTPLEAMAAGIPVILPEDFRPLFREASLYATPDEVQEIVMQLHLDQDYYMRVVERGLEFVNENFGYLRHRRRLAQYVTHLEPLLQT